MFTGGFSGEGLGGVKVITILFLSGVAGSLGFNDGGLDFYYSY